LLTGKETRPLVVEVGRSGIESLGELTI